MRSRMPKGKRSAREKAEHAAQTDVLYPSDPVTAGLVAINPEGAYHLKEREELKKHHVSETEFPKKVREEYDKKRNMKLGKDKIVPQMEYSEFSKKPIAFKLGFDKGSAPSWDINFEEDMHIPYNSFGEPERQSKEYEEGWKEGRDFLSNNLPREEISVFVPKTKEYIVTESFGKYKKGETLHMFINADTSSLVRQGKIKLKKEE